MSNSSTAHATSGPATTAALEVVAKQYVSDGICAITLASPDGRRLPDWTPGSHIDLILPNGLVRQYSLCGDRWDPHTYRVGVLRESKSRGGSTYIHDALAVGDMVGVGGPRNNFRLAPAARYAFIAGGIGITPLLPMVAQADLVGAEWTLHYGGRSRRSMAFLDELEHFGDHVIVVPEDEQGLLDLTAAIGSHDEATITYCCGPAGLLDAVAVAWADRRPQGLRTERFVSKELSAPTRDEPFVVELARSGGEILVDRDTTVLEALHSAGIDVLSSCRQGVCGTCETRVISGVPDHRDSLLDEEERAVGEFMFVCVSRSCSDRLVLDL